MAWSRRILCGVVLGAMLAPASSAGQDAPLAARATVSAIAPAADANADTAGYVFPPARAQLRDWALNAAGPAAIAGNLVGASWRQWATDEPAEWDADGRGFAQRFGTGSLTTFIGESSLSLASAAMRQDAGYYRSPRTGFGPRLRHALAMTFMARDRNGNAVFSPGKTFSPFVGPVSTQTTLYPGHHNLGDGMLSGAYGVLINAGWNAAREFAVKAPRWGGGRPPTR